jgi:ABC-type Mn2+/Zn2+ transport system ATPase subunit
LILDEPTASIDQENVAYFYKAVNELNEEGVTIVLISHDDDLEPLNYSHVLTVDTESDYKFRTRHQHEQQKAGGV